MSFGYDDISGTSAHITKMPNKKKAVINLYCERGIVSVHKMKNLFCDDCIREILNTMKDQLVEEFVIFDAKKKVFYSVDDETVLQIGNYELKSVFKDKNYEIAVKYVGK